MNENGRIELILPEKYKDVFSPQGQQQFRECLDYILTGMLRQGKIEVTIADGKVIRVFLGKHFDKIINHS